jgi:hypothetical protein
MQGGHLIGEKVQTGAGRAAAQRRNLVIGVGARHHDRGLAALQLAVLDRAVVAVLPGSELEAPAVENLTRRWSRSSARTRCAAGLDVVSRLGVDGRAGAIEAYRAVRASRRAGAGWPAGVSWGLEVGAVR